LVSLMYRRWFPASHPTARAAGTARRSRNRNGLSDGGSAAAFAERNPPDARPFYGN
jgi:hypothetical protein